jgi:hypothetical protein
MANPNPKRPPGFEAHPERINRKGQPKLPDLKELLAKVLGNTEQGRSGAEAILKAMEARAKRGDVRAAELLLDRAYGKPKQDIEMSANMTTVIMPKSLKQQQDGGEEVQD